MSLNYDLCLKLFIAFKVDPMSGPFEVKIKIFHQKSFDTAKPVVEGAMTWHLFITGYFGT